MNQEYSNPWDRRFLPTAIFLFTICGFGSGLIIYFIIDNIIILIIPSLLALLGILNVWYTEYYRRPIKVIVKSNGVELYFRYSKAISFNWNDLVAVCANPNSTSFNSTNGQGYNGSLIFRVNEPYNVSYRIASAVKEAYKNSTGTYPVKWNGHENYKKLRKRIMKSRTSNNY